jgi:hypothetical protein
MAGLPKSINAQWYKAHKMPEHPSQVQRAEWHIDHLKHCACRKPTPGVQKLIDEFRDTFK